MLRGCVTAIDHNPGQPCDKRKLFGSLVRKQAERFFGRKKTFHKNGLKVSLPAAGIQYKWAGNTLGGFSEIDEADIKKLAGWQKDRVACLMCMEADPDRCHRKNKITDVWKSMVYQSITFLPS